MPADIRELELNPSLRRARLNLEAATRARRGTNTLIERGLLTIPVIVHVVYKTDEDNIPDGQIESQIRTLNQDFRAQNSDINRIPEIWRTLAKDAQVEFRLADVTRTRTNENSFSSSGDPMKFALAGGHDVIDPDNT
jgi:hypothetical protein